MIDDDAFADAVHLRWERRKQVAIQSLSETWPVVLDTSGWWGPYSVDDTFFMGKGQDDYDPVRTAVEAWLNENTIGWGCSETFQWIIGFTNEADAVHFKLRWR